MKFAAAMLNVAGFGDKSVRFSDALQTISECGFEQVMLLSVRNSGPVLQRGVTPNGALVDLTGRIRDGKLVWDAPAGQWRIMIFTWAYDKHRRYPLVDGASQDAVDWYIKTVYQPHYDHFPDDFGKTIVGYFYDEPETYGDWGTEVIPMLKSRGVDWKKALVAWKFALADPDDQTASRYQYQDAFAEAWGKCLYGGLTQWCHDHKVLSIGHWLEHKRTYLSPRKCAGNMFQVQKYSDMGAIDAVYSQFAPGRPSRMRTARRTTWRWSRYSALAARICRIPR